MGSVHRDGFELEMSDMAHYRYLVERELSACTTPSRYRQCRILHANDIDMHVERVRRAASYRCVRVPATQIRMHCTLRRETGILCVTIPYY